MSGLTKDGVLGLKVSELKAELTKRGLQTAGIKSALQKRLLGSFDAEPPAAASTGMDVAGADDAAPAVEEDDETIDESVRYKGTVHKFFKRRGFGTIIPEGKTAEEKGDHVFVHWKQIQSSDPWPALEDGQVVEYYLGEKKKPRKPNQKTFAANVTLEGGNPVVVGPDATKTYPDKDSRFSGTVKWFDPRKGFGFIKPNEDFCFEEVDFTTDKANIYVCREDIKVADGVDSAPSLKDKSEVEFTLYKKDEGKSWGAGEVTKVGGEPLGTADFKERRTGGGGGRRFQKGKKGKGKKRKGKFQQMAMPMMNMMGGGMFGGMGGAQLVQMNGQTYMMMPQANMAGMMQFGKQGGRNKKRRRKNKKN